MGTSQAYEAPTTPQWGDLKTQVTRAASEGRPDHDLARDIVTNYIWTSRDSGNQTAHGSGGNKSAAIVAKNVAAFFSLVEQNGLREALKQTGLEFLQGRSGTEIILTLLDYLGGSSSTINDVDARNALAAVLDDICNAAEDYDDIETLLEEQANEEMLNVVLYKFFARYIFEQFCRIFYERLEIRVGEANAEAFLDGIRDYINSRVDDVSSHQDLDTIEWNGEEGLSITSEILEDTLEVFGG